MDTMLNQFHDAELNAIKHDRTASTVCLSFIQQNGTITTDAVFEGVCGFRVVDYGPQNVVSRLLSSSLSSLTHEDITRQVTWLNSTSEGKCLIDASAIDKLVERIERNELLLFVLEPSWGAEVSILARTFALR
jgi:hypothetical protein